MPVRRRSLKSLVFAALKRAGAENRLDVAEHLIRALEVLDGLDDQLKDRSIGRSHRLQ